ncbi:transmembrane protein 14C [Nymphalis io]|uniref:Transmembrane protein 14C n=1 Tax=Vanessa tameamea TaxID=334116 RepID=A0A8B8IQI3_VANTA|nr:transmembrane protein 14C [Vanessa tameamea]XP_047540177.1 transmembrane protein 14C [Vanessa atalanta]XP_050356253.1 transmembrane protein 14C [Nymphalis io]
MGLDIIGFAYAATVAAGGVMGYAKAGSIPSLGAGLIFGSILGVGAYQLSQDPSNYTLMMGTTTSLGGLMGYRYYNSRKFMPAGLMFVLSVGMFAKLLVKNVTASPMAVKSN